MIRGKRLASAFESHVMRRKRRLRKEFEPRGVIRRRTRRLSDATSSHARYLHGVTGYTYKAVSRPGILAATLE
eukprot:g66007.t1